MTSLLLFILVPIFACLVQYLFLKLKIKHWVLIPLLSSLITTALSIYVAFDEPTSFKLEWIHQWNMDLELSLNGISNIFIVLCSTAFLLQTILCLNKQKSPLYWCMNLSLQAAIFSFVLTQNLALRIISWELCWVPLFIILINTDQGHLSTKFSKIWFIAQTLLICGSIIIIGKFNKIHEAAFWLMLTALVIRMYLNTSKNLGSETTILVNVIVPLLPIVFFINTILPNFHNYIRDNFLIIAILVCTIALFWIFKLMVSKANSSIYTTNVLVFSSFVLIFLLKPELKIIQLCVQMVIAKTILNIIMTHYGHRYTNELKKWVFLIALLLAFGFSGTVIGIPMLKVLSLLNLHQQAIAISVLSLMFVLFIISVTKIAQFFTDKKVTIKENGWPEIIKLVAVLIIFAGVVVASIDPTYINNNVKKYSQSNLIGEP